MVGPSHLHAARRAADLEALAAGEVVDVLVVGGGVTGAGVALDAASRGLSVALLERADLASGTSRWSSKLVHGGLRYLAKGDVPMAWESARERGLLMGRIAPHLIRALPFLVPFGPGVGRGADRLVATGI
ncbi:MAG TPA: FAD-dependent oxidoreductase, partial [Solirubrobacteraceae bacterium]|nr:FAD-dependent oxidoreductase [Solirubrobacteraceae bacterium]